MRTLFLFWVLLIPIAESGQDPAKECQESIDSHMEKMRSAFNKLILIGKEAGCSYLEVQRLISDFTHTKMECDKKGIETSFVFPMDEYTSWNAMCPYSRRGRGGGIVSSADTITEEEVRWPSKNKKADKAEDGSEPSAAKKDKAERKKKKKKKGMAKKGVKKGSNEDQNVVAKGTEAENNGEQPSEQKSDLPKTTQKTQKREKEDDSIAKESGEEETVKLELDPDANKDGTGATKDDDRQQRVVHPEL